ncbi:MAG TPA: hypothetical protein VKM94_10050 [Blastocatellia bacterium]|nr:hypothetical protein [Blastocatellia bacterium]
MNGSSFKRLSAFSGIRRGAWSVPRRAGVPSTSSSSNKLQSAARSLCIATSGIILLSSLASSPVRARQHENHDSAAGSIPLEVLQRPVPLRTGIGSIHDPVTTSSKEAQAFYDQGLAYLHSYVWIEAARSFNQALRLDPGLAMACAGLSRAYSGLNSMAGARAALADARSRELKATTREQRRIALRDRQLYAMESPGNLGLFQQYKDAIDSALKADPSDVELWLLRGNAEEGNAGGRGQHGSQASIQFYERALQVSPGHFAAHHYLIHSLENCGRISEALVHAEIYAKMAPAVPHALHMYGHDLRRVGKINEAIAQFKRADELECAYYKAENIAPELDWHHEHNLDLLATSYQYQGKVKAAESLMREAFGIPSLQDTLEFNKKQWPAFLMLRGRNQEALEAALVLSKSRWDIVRSIGHVMASHALLTMNRTSEAGEQAKAALAELKASGGRAQFVAPYLESLQGEFYLRTGQAERGREILKEVERKLRQDQSPDAWIQTLFRLEAIARAARDAGDVELSEYTARQMLEHDPAYGGTHYAMALALASRNDNKAAEREFSLALKYWSEADPDFPELAEIRSRKSRQ